MTINYNQFLFYSKRSSMGWGFATQWVDTRMEKPKWFWEIISQNGYRKIPVTAQGWAELRAIEGPVCIMENGRPGEYSSVQEFLNLSVSHQNGIFPESPYYRQEDVDNWVDHMGQQLNRWPERNWDFSYVLQPELCY